MSTEGPRFSIGYAAQCSGVSTHAIRIWERRHGAVAPERSASGQRLYSDADVERLKLLRRATEAGHSIGHAAPMSDEDLRKLLRDAAQAPPRAAETLRAGHEETTEATSLLAACHSAVIEMDQSRLEELVTMARLRLGGIDFITAFIVPLMHWVGDEWRAGRLRIAHEHMATTTVRALLTRMSGEATRGGKAARPVVATPAGQHHELGALLASIVLTMEGARPVYLGPDLPAAEIAEAAAIIHAPAAVLSATLAGREQQLLQELREVRALLPEQTQLVVGGAGAAAIAGDIEELGAAYLSDLQQLQEWAKSSEAGL